MRTIKFRVWNRKEKDYTEDEVLIDAISGVPHIRMVIKGKPVLAFTSNYIIEQYTGLKDKKGVEIYEGDKIKYVHESNTYLDEDLNKLSDDWIESTIIWGNEYPAFDVENHSEEYNLLSSPEYIIEVVGNIHETN